ncbi:RNA pseudouridine synthase [Caenimonas koreensis]|uniref:Dual-specificity RNA pseudouridine synthase RluF n=1 Tax=Caenimonas koreensis DSM 17982 TaxID=1121255 RepID=A0A844B2T9_9BURK|nr:RNA pseudouridine synthase [Caenimonas koreensis]MRD47572.1 RNA-binding protein [Caenimonas koreensis DSM 17982]
MAEPIRLAKRVAALAQCSRREAELFIEGGWVRVDGVVVEEPQSRVAEQQNVVIDPHAVAEDAQPVTLLLHKPVGMGYDEAQRLLTPANHAAEAGTSGGASPRILKRHFAKLAPMLDMPAQASGLAVYSQDFRIVRKLTEDALLIEQELVVEVSGTIRDGGMALLANGLAYRGWRLPPAKVSWQSETRLRFAIKGMDPALVPWMCEEVGLRPLSMKRLRLGRVPLAGLPLGQWRYLPADARF